MLNMSDAEEDGTRVSGTVKWFDPSKGFGFVVANEGGPDILLHANVLRNFGQSSVADACSPSNVECKDSTAHYQLGPTEYRLLKFFMESPGRVFSRGQLLDGVWGTDSDIELRTVDVHIRRLRKALQRDEADYSGLIQTVRGTGYRFSSRGL